MTVAPDDGLLPFSRAADLPDASAQHPWLIDQLWAAAGVGIVGGAPKCCKSWLALDMAVSVASATPALGSFRVAQSGGVLCYLAEDAVAGVKARLTGLCRSRSVDLRALPLDVITAPSLRLDLAADQRRLDRTVRACAPRMLLLDPFVRLHRMDENHSGDVSALLGYLRQIQREHDVAVVVVHHARKNGSVATAGQALRGSGDFHAWGDSNLYLRRTRDQLLLTIEHRAAPAPDPISLALVHDGQAQDAHLEVTNPTPAAPQRNPLNNADLDAVALRAIQQAQAPLSRNALRATLRVRNERLGDALARLQAAGHVSRSGDAWAATVTAVPVPTSL
jgi:hypothetical protein